MAKSLLNSSFSNKNVLFLQGPVGPFFRRLAKDLQTRDNKVYKINFNGGDYFFFPQASNYRESIEKFPEFLLNHIHTHQINAVVLFGDCRPIHCVALNAIKNLDLDVFVFEEGYLRPDHITLEQVGVNSNSLLPKTAEYYSAQTAQKIAPVSKIGNAFWHAASYAILYYIFANLFRPWFSEYKHHRSLHIKEAWYWIKGTWRKYFFAWRERGIEQQLSQPLKKRFFLIPLQLSSDAQVTHHSEFDSVTEFISSTIKSFAQHAPKDTFLAIKHHPYDRGYHDYTKLIDRLAQKWQVSNRIFYIHDQRLPQLLQNARGVVTINSTTGLSALYHHAPTKVCGDAVYDIPGLCYQGDLNDFWNEAAQFEINPDLYSKYIAYLEQRCQINGSFYRRIKNSGNHAGLNLSRENFL